jgi:23S rRNA (uridine2552-2'-O)-methyltransferase
VHHDANVEKKQMQIKGNRSLSSRLWLDRQVNDPYVKKAHADGYRSRAAFKLIEMDEKFHLTAKAKLIVDLGAAPGSWSQVLSRRTSPDTKICAIDLLHFDPIDNKVQQFVGDFEDETNQSAIMNYLNGKADLVVSDMAPSTIGHAQTDHIRIMQLASIAHSFAMDVLKKNGTFLTKIFQGGNEKLFAEKLKKDFQKVCFFKPKSSRSLSSEIYIIAMGFNEKCN